jgi:dUTP pyrophosphatase
MIKYTKTSSKIKDLARATKESAAVDLRANLVDGLPARLAKETEFYMSWPQFVASKEHKPVMHAAIAPGETIMVPTGIKIAIPKGSVGLVFSRSGMSAKRNLTLVNGVGVIDSDYDGEIVCALRNDGQRVTHVENGERIAQLAIVPMQMDDFVTIDLEEHAKIHGAKGSDRSGGYGSTGTK